MRTIELLAQTYPDKTGAELLEIREQEKAEEKAKIAERNKKLIEFAEDINTNGGYFKGSFGLNQRYIYRITNVKVFDSGEMYGDEEKIILFMHKDFNGGKNTFNGTVDCEIRIDKQKSLSNSGILCEDDRMLFRTTKEDFDEIKSHVLGIDKFWYDTLTEEEKR